MIVDNYFTRQYIPEDNSEQHFSLFYQPRIFVTVTRVGGGVVN
jgi:hypothetical protein